MSDTTPTTSAIQAVQAVSGAPQAQVQAAPTGTLPNGAPITAITGQTPQLDTSAVNSSFNAMNQQKIDAINAAGPVNMGMAQAGANVNQYMVDAQKARLAAISTASNQLQQFSPSNYTQKASPDGGYNFFDGAQNPVSLSQYIAATGKNPATVLKGSQNPGDINYVNDHTVLQNIGQAMLSGDQKQMDTLNSKFGGTLKPALDNLGLWNTPGAYDKLAQGFMKYYGNVWGGGPNGSTPNSQSYIFNTPAGKAADQNYINNLNSNPLNQLQSLLGG